MNYLGVILYFLLSCWLYVLSNGCKPKNNTKERSQEKISIPYKEPKDKIILKEIIKYQARYPQYFSNNPKIKSIVVLSHQKDTYYIGLASHFFYLKNQKYTSYFSINGQPVLYYVHSKNVKNYPIQKDSTLIVKLNLDTSPAVSIVDIPNWEVIVKKGKILYKNEYIYGGDIPREILFQYEPQE